MMIEYLSLADVGVGGGEKKRKKKKRLRDEFRFKVASRAHTQLLMAFHLSDQHIVKHSLSRMNDKVEFIASNLRHSKIYFRVGERPTLWLQFKFVLIQMEW